MDVFSLPGSFSLRNAWCFSFYTKQTPRTSGIFECRSTAGVKSHPWNIDQPVGYPSCCCLSQHYHTLSNHIHDMSTYIVYHSIIVLFLPISSNSTTDEIIHSRISYIVQFHLFSFSAGRSPQSAAAEEQRTARKPPRTPKEITMISPWSQHDAKTIGVIQVISSKNT